MIKVLLVDDHVMLRKGMALLEKAAAFNASDDTLDNLHREVEGWVVGLRLVSQVLRSNQDQEGFLQNLHGGVQQTKRLLGDYHAIL